MADKRNSVKIFQNKAVFSAVTGFTRPSANIKTGDMLQVTILSPSISPKDAKHSGGDSEYCGGENNPCPMHEVCYVLEFQMPEQVWRAVHADKPELIPTSPKAIRLGAYGDPAFLPLPLLAELTKGKNFTGYTNQWRYGIDTAYSQYCMASVTSLADRSKAKTLGYRTYRALRKNEAPAKGEVMCPYYTSGGAVQCVDCRLCSGLSSGAKDIVAPISGNKKGKVPQ
jgi:hypothetical protein